RPDRTRTRRRNRGRRVGQESRGDPGGACERKSRSRFFRYRHGRCVRVGLCRTGVDASPGGLALARSSARSIVWIKEEGLGTPPPLAILSSRGWSAHVLGF